MIFRLLLFNVLVSFLLIVPLSAAANNDLNRVKQSNAKIEHFVTNKQYTQAFSYCNKELKLAIPIHEQRFLIISKLRLFAKSKTSIDSIPILFNRQKKLVSPKDSLSLFLDARSEEILGHYYYLKGYKENAFKQLIKADELFQLADAISFRVYNLNMLGTLYLLDNNLTESLITLTRANSIQQKYLLNDTSLYIDIQIDIGLIYFKTKKFLLAKSIYEKLLKYPVSKSQLAQVLNNLAIISIEESRFEDAVLYLRQAEDYYVSIGATSSLAGIYNNLASAFDELDMPFDTVSRYFIAAINFRQKLGDSVGVVGSTLNLAALYLQNNQTQKTTHLVHGLDEYKKHFSLQDLATKYFILYLIDTENNNFKSSLANYKLYHFYNDSIKKTQSAIQLARAEKEIMLEKKQGQLSLMLREQVAIKAHAKQQRLIIILLAIAAIITTLTLTLIALYYYKRQLLEKKIRNREVVLASVSNLVRGQEEERLRIAKDLHDGVGNNLAILNAEILKLKPAHTNNYLASLVTQTAEEVRNITHDLMPVAIRKFGLKSALKDLIEKWKHARGVYIDVNYNDDFDIDNNTSLTIYRIIQELIKNAVSHGSATYISFLFSASSQDLLIVYEDNGTGFPEGFPEKSTGTGLQNISHRVRFLNGIMDVSSSKQGLKITFLFKDLLP